MKKAIGAFLFHCCEATDPEARDLFCDKNEATWCKFHEAKLKGKVYKEKPGIPKTIKKKIEPIFHDFKFRWAIK